MLVVFDTKTRPPYQHREVERGNETGGEGFNRSTRAHLMDRWVSDRVGETTVLELNDI